jgi:hypothetical protein
MISGGFAFRSQALGAIDAMNPREELLPGETDRRKDKPRLAASFFPNAAEFSFARFYSNARNHLRNDPTPTLPS